MKKFPDNSIHEKVPACASFVEKLPPSKFRQKGLNYASFMEKVPDNASFMKKFLTLQVV
jgi:hypothetical protein